MTDGYPAPPRAEERRVLGHPVPRIEDRPLVTGHGRYAGDVSFPRQLHMRMVRASHAHAHIVSIDAAAARALSRMNFDRAEAAAFLAEPHTCTSNTPAPRSPESH